jgi:hypothetical protein
MARRGQAQLINFGVAAVARAIGETPQQRLELRCECGAHGCHARVRMTRGQYEAAAAAGAEIIAPRHPPDQPQRHPDG